MLSALQPTELFINSDQHWKKYRSVNFWGTLLQRIIFVFPLLQSVRNMHTFNEIFRVYTRRFPPICNSYYYAFVLPVFFLVRSDPEPRTFNREIYISGCLCYVKFSSSVPPTEWFICSEGNVTEFWPHAVSILSMNAVSCIGKLWNKIIIGTFAKSLNIRKVWE